MPGIAQPPEQPAPLGAHMPSEYAFSVCVFELSGCVNMPGGACVGAMGMKRVTCSELPAAKLSGCGSKVRISLLGGPEICTRDIGMARTEFAKAVELASKLRRPAGARLRSSSMVMLQRGALPRMFTRSVNSLMGSLGTLDFAFAFALLAAACAATALANLLVSAASDCGPGVFGHVPVPAAFAAFALAFASALAFAWAFGTARRVAGTPNVSPGTGRSFGVGGRFASAAKMSSSYTPPTLVSARSSISVKLAAIRRTSSVLTYCTGSTSKRS
mmetsp:Transcript_46812/g.150460  ORF Transcript_46812/g.150460 Transcript_46812/m.150460 type:complete len:273 (+) Transcript_46812:910-1728(+)